jgi:hypothetical protein
MAARVEKTKPRPARAILAVTDDHPVGLWIDKDLLRKHTRQIPRTIIHGNSEAAGNRYLELADIALGVKSRKKPASK